MWLHLIHRARRPAPQRAGHPAPRDTRSWPVRPAAPVGALRAALRVGAALGVGGALGLAGCAPEGAWEEPAGAPAGALAQHRQPIEARCTALVGDVGEVDVETVYLPAVVACENGAATDEALRAQAVSARSYLYYKLATSGSIGDGTGDQVFTCNRPPNARHLAAVEATEGQVLTNAAGNVIAAFYVAGAIPSTADCRPAPGDNDPTSTERWVTYNEGRRGAEVQPTPLGHPANPLNRGCKSQNGASCLGGRGGLQYPAILRFYYGADIGLETAVGPCVGPRPVPDAGVMPDAAPPRDAAPPADLGGEDSGPGPDVGIGPPPTCTAAVGASPAEVLIDDTDACFTRSCESGDWWVSHPVGEGGGALTVNTIERDRPDCTGRWSFNVTAAGTYAVEVLLPDTGLPLSRAARYVVRHAAGQDEVRLDQSARFGTVSLGRFAFARGADAWVVLADNTGEPFADDGPRVVFDAVRLRLVALDPAEGQEDGGAGAGGVGPGGAGGGGAGGDGGGGSGGSGAIGGAADGGGGGPGIGPGGTRGVAQSGGCAQVETHLGGDPSGPTTRPIPESILAFVTLGLVCRRRRSTPTDAPGG